MRRPRRRAVGFEGLQVGVQRHRVGDAQLVDRRVHDRRVALVGLLGRVHAHHDQAVVLVLLVDGLELGDLALAVRARARPEVHERHHPGRLAQGIQPLRGLNRRHHAAVLRAAASALREVGAGLDFLFGLARAVLAGALGARLERGRVVGDHALQSHRGVRRDTQRERDHGDARRNAQGTLARLQEARRHPGTRDRDDHQRDRHANREGDGQADDVPRDLPGARGHDDRGQHRTCARHERRAQNEAEAEAPAVTRRTRRQACERALQDLHDLRNDHADTDGQQQDDARPADQRLRQVQQAQQRRTRDRDQHERGHQAQDDEHRAARHRLAALCCDSCLLWRFAAQIHARSETEERRVHARLRFVRGCGRAGGPGLVRGGRGVAPARGTQEERGQDREDARGDARDEAAEKA